MPSHIADQVVIACDTFLFLKVFIYEDIYRYIYAHTHMKIIFSNHKYVLGIGKWKCATRKVMHYVRKWEVARAVWAEQAPGES